MYNQQNGLYLLVVLLTFGVTVMAIGGGLFNQQEAWPLQWQNQAFSYFCHQMPSRSFFINGQPTAVCSRCLGVYISFTLGWMLLPLVSFLTPSDLFSFKKWALLAVAINIGDIIGNVLGFWENTLISRFLFGIMLGGTTALIFSGVFFRITNKSKGNHHGRITPANAK